MSVRKIIVEISQGECVSVSHNYPEDAEIEIIDYDYDDSDFEEGVPEEKIRTTKSVINYKDFYVHDNLDDSIIP